MKLIEGFDYYYITEDGKLYSNAYGELREIAQQTDRKGYKRVGLSNRKSYRVHRLVARAYIPNPHGYEQVNHKNEIKDDNRVENLEWCTNDYNKKYSAKWWKVLTPEGNVEDIKNLEQYCRDKKINAPNMRTRGVSKGYRLVRD